MLQNKRSSRSYQLSECSKCTTLSPISHPHRGRGMEEEYLIDKSKCIEAGDKIIKESDEVSASPARRIPKSGPTHGNWKGGGRKNPSRMTVGVRGKDKNPRKKGKDHGNWRGGDSRTRDYDSLKYGAWKEAVLRRCNFHCVVTGDFLQRIYTATTLKVGIIAKSNATIPKMVLF